ncbi:hypothetical protein OESDEN_24613 [Oesophagostomum dentatum]|uniref:Uncharacterized protein n=1 Tax=Oesophagostomum dentatum TaxID=61180 RepID=A0A0B1RVU9_OESDE|nr:hypothetical protein OESDEN_24613 [Oesophagostomum dentatum]
MSMAEFTEFRKRVAESILKMRQDVRRYPTFNSDYNRAKPLSHFGEDERYGVELWLGKKCPKTKLPSTDRCCIAMKFRGGWVRCNRMRSRRNMNDALEKVALMKRLNIGLCREDPHLGICLFHWRLIRYARQDSPLTEEQLRSWEACETQAEKNDRDEDANDIIAIESSTSSDHDDSDDSTEKSGEGNTERIKYNWRENDLKRRKTKSPSDEGDETEEHRDSEEDEKNGLCTLSAASLRRYRKYFMIPTKASASKHAVSFVFSLPARFSSSG